MNPAWAWWKLKPKEVNGERPRNQKKSEKTRRNKG
jgi:hypothetical protein